MSKTINLIRGVLIYKTSEKTKGYDKTICFGQSESTMCVVKGDNIEEIKSNFNPTRIKGFDYKKMQKCGGWELVGVEIVKNMGKSLT
jgi:hypothetical protein